MQNENRWNIVFCWRSYCFGYSTNNSYYKDEMMAKMEVEE